MKLSPFERMTLANQFRILEKLDPDGGHYAQSAGILECGYEGLYPKIFEYQYEPTSKAVSDEVYEIFDMFRALDRAYEKGISKPPGHCPEFSGFDANNDKHHSVAVFILKDLNLYEELHKHPTNSHSQTELHCYRRMLGVWNSMGKPYQLKEDQVKAIVAG
jgi:uncharacterized protein YfbU (UPF0304 family)